ncbi:hypothetical protein VYU27_003112 [Nannochloropsis oceanica]
MATPLPASQPPASSPPAMHWCSGCAATKETRTLACAKCKAAWFCSKDCQTTAWKAGHKEACKSTLLYNRKAYPPELLSKAPLDVIDKWVTHVASLPHFTSPVDILHRRAALQMLLACLVILPPDAPGRLGLLPGFARILQERKQREGRSSSHGSRDDGKDEDLCKLTLKILVVCLQQDKLNASLFYLCGGTQALADLVFLDRSSSSSSTASPSDEWTPVGERQVLALSALVHALMEPNDFVLVGNTLGVYPATEVLVPVLLHLMDPCVPKAEEEEDREEVWKARLRQHQDATNLLTLCINLKTEVPLQLWQEGFRILKELTRFYLEPRPSSTSKKKCCCSSSSGCCSCSCSRSSSSSNTSSGTSSSGSGSTSNSSSSSSSCNSDKKSLGELIMENARLSLLSSSSSATQAQDESSSFSSSSSSAQSLSVHLRWLLLDINALLSGFVDHFPQAVHLVLPLGLPTLLGLHLSFSADESVQQTALLITRHCLKGTSSLHDFNDIVGANESKIFGETVKTIKKAVAALLEMGADARIETKKKKKRKEKGRKKAADEEEKEKEIQVALLKGGLSLSAECLKANPSLLQAYLPNLFLVLRLVLTNCCPEEKGEREREEVEQSHILSAALNEALACVLNALLYLPSDALDSLLGCNDSDSSSRSSRSSRSGNAWLLASLHRLLNKHKHDRPPSVASVICNIYAVLAGCSSSGGGSGDKVKAEEVEDQKNDIPLLLTRFFLDEKVQDHALIKEAIFALQEFVWACPQMVLPQLRAMPDAAALQTRLGNLVESGAVECEYLARVLKGGEGGEDDEKLLGTTPIKTGDWMDHGGLGRSVVKTMMHDRLEQFLLARNEINCGASGRPLAEGDRIMRLTKCQHWFLEGELRKVVLGEDNEAVEEGGVLSRYWKEDRTETLCPVCGRHMRVEIRD